MICCRFIILIHNQFLYFRFRSRPPCVCIYLALWARVQSLLVLQVLARRWFYLIYLFRIDHLSFQWDMLIRILSRQIELFLVWFRGISACCQFVLIPNIKGLIWPDALQLVETQVISADQVLVELVCVVTLQLEIVAVISSNCSLFRQYDVFLLYLKLAGWHRFLFLGFCCMFSDVVLQLAYFFILLLQLRLHRSIK